MSKRLRTLELEAKKHKEQKSRLQKEPARLITTPLKTKPKKDNSRNTKFNSLPERHAQRHHNDVPSRVSPCDLKIKLDAFTNDLKLPLNGANIYISSIGGLDVAKGYEKVIADGESLWLQLSKSQIYWAKFKRRQRTSSRQYWTLEGVTLHEQLRKEDHPYPRKNKLSVRIDRSEPCSRLIEGKYYIHVHQVKMNNPRIGTRWLGTTRLVKKLKEAFGSSYNPKPIKNMTFQAQHSWNLKADKRPIPQSRNRNVVYPLSQQNQNQEQPLMNMRQYTKRRCFPIHANNGGSGWPVVSYAQTAKQNVPLTQQREASNFYQARAQMEVG